MAHPVDERGNEERLRGRQSILFAIKHVQPPSFVYIGPGDALKVRLYSSNSAFTGRLRGRILLVDGEVMPFDVALNVRTDRVGINTFIPMPEGFLLQMAFSPGTTYRGQTWARVSIIRGITGVEGDQSTVIMGNLHNAYQPTYPPGVQEPQVSGHGFLNSVLGTNPAAGAEIAEAVPTGARYKLRAMRFTLVASADVATRQVSLVIKDASGNAIDEYPCVTTQTAGVTQTYIAAPYGFGPAILGTHAYIPIPLDLEVFQGWTIATSTVNIQAADDFAAPRMHIEEWIEV